MTYNQIKKHLENGIYVRRAKWVKYYYIELSHDPYGNEVIWLTSIFKYVPTYSNGYTEVKYINGVKCDITPMKVINLTESDLKATDWMTVNSYIRNKNK